eukprot:Mrub_02421.p1 GENE.Mrub_02421~~Mrub_02421.p1  ORF type:complete len:554 (-),score=60.61 Mrub_02421:60-1670(-)
MIQPNEYNDNTVDLSHEFSEKDCKLKTFNKFNLVKQNSNNTDQLRYKCKKNQLIAKIEINGYKPLNLNEIIHDDNEEYNSDSTQGSQRINKFCFYNRVKNNSKQLRHETKKQKFIANIQGIANLKLDYESSCEEDDKLINCNKRNFTPIGQNLKGNSNYLRHRNNNENDKRNNLNNNNILLERKLHLQTELNESDYDFNDRLQNEDNLITKRQSRKSNIIDRLQNEDNLTTKRQSRKSNRYEEVQSSNINKFITNLNNPLTNSIHSLNLSYYTESESESLESTYNDYENDFYNNLTESNLQLSSFSLSNDYINDLLSNESNFFSYLLESTKIEQYKYICYNNKINIDKNQHHAKFYKFISQNILTIFKSKSKQIILYILIYGITHDLEEIIYSISDNLTEFYESKYGINILLSIFEYHNNDNKSVLYFFSKIYEDLNYIMITKDLNNVYIKSLEKRIFPKFDAYILEDCNEDSVKFVCDILISSSGIKSFQSLIHTYGYTKFKEKLKYVEDYSKKFTGKKRNLLLENINDLNLNKR